MSTHRKGAHGDPRTLVFEAAGLRWLAEASEDGGAAVAEIVAEELRTLQTRKVDHGTADREAAEAFGRALARTHAAGASHHGCAPPGFEGDGFMGRATLPLRAAPPSGDDPWGAFYAADRILPYLATAVANGSIDRDGARTVERCAARVAEGVFDAPQPAAVHGVARLHGDLWSGNVLWARSGAGTVGTLIDPAAQGGHAESDLAQLGVFGAPHLDRIVAAYDESSPLADGWRERVGLHQLHMLIVHAALFGGSYGAQTVAVAARYT
jgi:fructosamine-3-kinase